MADLTLTKNRIPEFVIFTGPMFGSKTTRLIAAIDRFSYQKRNIISFKPKMDERYSVSKISTHSGASVPALCIDSGTDILEYIKSTNSVPDVVAVDEAFMIDGISEVLISLFRSGVTVVVSSLQLSASGRVFEEVRDIMPWATKIEVCPAVCTVTGLDAFYTHRKFDNMDEITVGGSDLYEPRSWHYHPYMNQGVADVDG
tara:strand:+ start:8069 stop:8668 length:600 start_codon:yes stop_codon:yes gene_type:complete